MVKLKARLQFLLDADKDAAIAAAKAALEEADP